MPELSIGRAKKAIPGTPPGATLGQRLNEYLNAMRILPSSLRLPTNDSLYNWGEQGDLLYVVESGCVKTMTYSAVGKACLLDIYGPGDIIGESCLLGCERTETATAMLPTVLRKVRRNHFLESFADDSLREELLRYLANRILQQQRTIAFFVMMDSEQRLAATLLRLGRKLGVREGDFLLIPHRITHEELGGLVGTTRSRVGFFLKRFRDTGLVEPRRPWSLAVNERRVVEYAQGNDLW